MAASFSASPTACDSLSMTQGPAMSTRAPTPSVTPSATVTGFTQPLAQGSNGGHVRGDPLKKPLPLVRRLDESGKQRMRAQGLGLELGVELNRDVPRMAGQLDDLDELAVER